MTPPRLLALILLAYFALGTQYVLQTPAWQVPDEPAHYNVIRTIATTGTLPIMEKGDYDQKYLEQLTAQKFPPSLPIDPVRYQDYQPPLYYLLLTPVYLATNGNLIALRFASLILGAGVIGFAFLVIQQIFPTRPALALLTASFIAFLPQQTAVFAGVNNDSLAELVIAIGLWLTLRKHRELELRALGFGDWDLGFILGVAFLTKVQAYILAPTIVLMLAFHWRSLLPRLSSLFLLFGIAFAVGALYWVRYLYVYGFPDFLGAARHNSVVIGQPTTSEWIAQYGFAEVARRFFETTFHSFWGQFGWMAVPMDGQVYNWIGRVMVVLGVGLAGALYLVGASLYQRLTTDDRRPTTEESPSSVVRRPSSLLSTSELQALALLATILLFTILIYLYYNTNFVQHQGRYLFPGIIPIGFAVAASVYQWARWLGRFVGRFQPYVLPIVSTSAVLLLVALDAFAIYRYLPQLY